MPAVSRLVVLYVGEKSTNCSLVDYKVGSELFAEFIRDFEKVITRFCVLDLPEDELRVFLSRMIVVDYANRVVHPFINVFERVVLHLDLNNI